MLDPVPQELNRNNLITAAAIFSGLRYFAFYGTILGLTRGADIIEGDDDIDFLMNIDDRDEVVKRLESSKFDFDLKRPVNQTYFFLQATLVQKGITTYIDVYFFEDKDNQDYIVDRWNFLGKWQDPNSALHIPKQLVYPLQEEEFFGVGIQCPANKAGICEFLYGSDWQTPKSKRTGYSMAIENHKPIMKKKITVNLADASSEVLEIISRMKNIDKRLRIITIKAQKLQQEKNKLNQQLMQKLEE